MTQSIPDGRERLTEAFERAAEPVEGTSPAKPKRSTTSSVISMRVTADERVRLEKEAAGISLSQFLRERVLDGQSKPRRTRGKFPVKDHEALARVLGRLGRSSLYTNLHRLLLAVEEGRVPLERDMAAELRHACAEVRIMRDDLVTALGLQA